MPLRLFVLLLALVCSPVPAAEQPAAAHASASAIDLEPLRRLIDERLALMPDVARHKWNTDSAIDDLPREQQLIDSLMAQAQQLGIPAPWAERFFRAQIEGAKQVQRAHVARWKQASAGKFGDVPDLATVTRPRLDTLTAHMLRELAADWPALADPSQRARIGAVMARLDNGTPEAAATVIAPLIDGSASSMAARRPDRSLLQAAQQRKNALVKDLAKLVNIDSGTDDAKGLAQVAAVLAQRLKQAGASVEVIDAPPAAGKMVIGRLHGTGTRNIMLMIHYDTVFGIGDAAKRPFTITGNKAYGPGVADAKSGALLIVHALAIARERRFNDYRTITVLFNPDEEKSSLGSRDLIAKLAAEQDIVLVFEPPEADVVTVATNGIAYVHLDVKGRASHAGSAPEAGRNAAIELANQVIRLKDLGNPAKGTTVSWTVLQAGERVNVIPDKASATADMRMSDVGEIVRVQAEADKIVQTTLIPDTEVRVTLENRRPPFSKNSGSDRLAAVADSIYQELGKSIRPVAMRYGTDAGFAYHPKASKPVVLDGMGIVGNRIHSPDEWADLDSVVPRLYLTVRMLETIGK